MASSNSYFVDAVVEAVIDDLMSEKGVTRTMAQKMVYNNDVSLCGKEDFACERKPASFKKA